MVVKMGVQLHQLRRFETHRYLAGYLAIIRIIILGNQTK